MDDNKDRYDDLASLFLPDILHQAPSPAIGAPPSGSTTRPVQELAGKSSGSPTGLSNTIKFLANMPNNSLTSNFSNFLPNNDLIAQPKPEISRYDSEVVDSSDPRPMTSSQAGPNGNENVRNMDQPEPPHQYHSLGHYSNFVPSEALLPHHHHNHVLSSQLFPSSNTQPTSLNKGLDPSWFNGSGLGSNPGSSTDLENRQAADKMATNFGQPSLNYADLLDQNAFLLQQLQQQQQQQMGGGLSMHMLSQQLQLPGPQQFNMTPGMLGPGGPTANQLFDNSLNVPSAETKEKTPVEVEKKRKRNYRQKPKRQENIKFLVDYSPDKLTHLLNFRTRKLNEDYKLIDKNGEEIYLDFKGFLNGRFLTNDFDNSSYIHGILDRSPEEIESFETSDTDNAADKDTDGTSGKSNTEKDDSGSPKEPKRKYIKSDPKVISCYRRNYIQVSMNFNLSGFKGYSNDEAKILKLQTSEYGYNITRVVKWLKIEVTASTNDSKEETVPLIINDDIKEKDKKDGKDEVNDDYVNPTPITSNEHIITLNNANVIDNEINNFFTVKKLRFQSATSNNGNFGFQNYYFLKVKLSAIVADLYYDDYIDDDFSVANPDNSRNEINLFELISEPIIVRGRNPSFYAERNDLLVRGKPVNNKQSYKHDGKADIVRNDIRELRNEQEIKRELEREQQQQQQHNNKRKASKDPEGEGSEAENNDGDNGDKRHKSPTPLQMAAMNQANLTSKSISPLIYNANSSSVNLDKILKGKDKQLILNDNNDETYTYFPISNVYYLPPINVVYFPHAAHQNAKNPHKTNSPSVEDVSFSRRKSSNVYFK